MAGSKKRFYMEKRLRGFVYLLFSILACNVWAYYAVDGSWVKNSLDSILPAERVVAYSAMGLYILIRLLRL